MTTKSGLTMPVTEGRDHILGPGDAPVTIVEYGDFECPHCGLMHPILKALLERFPTQVRLVYRHFPLSQVHKHAMHAAEASEAASAQGKFWEMHELLFANQMELTDESLLERAEDLELDVETFVSELKSNKYLARVKEDFSAGIRSGVNGTPTLFVNGERYNGTRDLETLAGVVETIAGA